MDLFSWIKITARAEVFVSYAMFLSGACPDSRAHHGIWKRCCPALGILDLGWLLEDSSAVGEALLGKQQFGVLPRVGRWMLS
jgi:hypothetical protein